MESLLANILMYALVLGMGLALVVSIWAWRRARCLAHTVEEQQASIVQLRQDVQALCAGAVGLGDRLAGIEQHSRRLKERQEQLELRENGERLYSQAIRMVQKGADADELVEVCGLSRSEADLVAMMHRMEEAV